MISPSFQTKISHQLFDLHWLLVLYHHFSASVLVSSLFIFFLCKNGLRHSRDAAAAPISVKTVKTFYPHSSWSLTKFHWNTASSWGRGCLGKWTKIPITKLLILNYRIWGPTRRRSTEKRWWWCHHLPSGSSQVAAFLHKQIKEQVFG